MITEYDNELNITDVLFEGDICEYCMHNGLCILIKALQSNMVVIDDLRPVTECCFYE